MKWMHRLPLRYSLPILLCVFAVLISLLAFFNARPVVYKVVEDEAVSRMRAKLTETQGALELLWKSGDLNAVRQLVATYGSELGETSTVLLGPDGLILASTSLSIVGKPASGIQRDLAGFDEVFETGGTYVRLDKEQEIISGAARVCGPNETSLRARNCGYLLHERSLHSEISAAVGIIRSQTVSSLLSTAVGSVLLLWFTHLLVTRRAQPLVQSARAFAQGDTKTRTRMSGGDEFAEISSAFDAMLDVVEADQSKLRLWGDALDASTNGILVTDANQSDLPIIYCNPAFEEITGFSFEEVKGKNCRFLHAEMRDQPQLETLRKAIRDRISCSVILRNQRKDGTLFWNELSVSPVRDADGKTTHFIGIQNDISTRREAQEALQKSHRTLEDRVTARTQELADAYIELEAADAGKSQFLAAASHDLRQPLQAINTYLTVLSSKLDAADQKNVAEKMGQSLKTMGGLLDALLDVSKFESGSVTPEKKSFSVQDLLDAAVADHDPAAQVKGITLNAVSSDLALYSDPALLLRILENFVTNAIRYTDEGSVDIRCEQFDDFVRISVSDTGIGIPQEAASKIFDEYYQLGNAHRDQSKGLGLGLSIVKRIAKILGHELEVESAVGSGSRFSVRVPLADDQPERLVTPSPALKKGGDISVLIVDDDPAVLDSMKLLLEMDGYSVHGATNADEAIAAARNGFGLDIVLSDYRMPGLSGVELVNSLRETLGTSIPAIIMSGETKLDDLESSVTGECEFVQKPADPDHISRLIERLVN